MAQQLGAIRFKGKVANVVGFKNSASIKTNNNFVRERATIISNPKSMAQARQRAKTIPAQNFYAAFENVLNHAFLPTERASRNRNAFMSKAMKLNEIPNVVKGNSNFPICRYQVSQGSLGLDDLTIGQENSTVIFGLGVSQNWNGDSTIAQISTDVLNSNSSLEEGMELTFIIIAGEADNDIHAKSFSFVLDKDNTLTKLSDVAGSGWALNSVSGKCTLVHSTLAYCAAALIISSKYNNTWRYTNSFMNLTTVGIANREVYPESEVIASYMSTASNRTSDLVLQQADNSQSGEVHLSSVTTANITLATGVTGTLSANAANVAVKSTGDRMLVVLDGALTTGAAGSRVAITITPAGGTARPLTPADTTFAGNESITVAELEAAGL